MPRPKIAEEKKYTTLSFRLDQEALTFIEAYTVHLNRRFVGLQADKSTAVRMLLQLGIESVKAGYDPATPQGQLVTELAPEPSTNHEETALKSAKRSKGRV